jgi:type IV secretory pathway TraG/TraD family ATPase VirD4
MKMDPFPCGYQWIPAKGKSTKPEMYDFSQHIQIKAPTGSGKGVCLEMVALLQHLRNSTVLNIDPTLQNGAVCAAARRAMGHEVWSFNPDGVHVGLYPDLACMGFNSMDALDPKDPPRFSARARAIGEALVPLTGSTNGRFFESSGAGLVGWVSKYVKLRDGDNAHLGTVRDLITEAEETDDDGVPIKGLRATAALALAMGEAIGDADLVSMAGRYTKETRSNNDVIATVESETRCLGEPNIRAALSRKNGISFERARGAAQDDLRHRVGDGFRLEVLRAGAAGFPQLLSRQSLCPRWRGPPGRRADLRSGANRQARRLA